MQRSDASDEDNLAGTTVTQVPSSRLAPPSSLQESNEGPVFQGVSERAYDDLGGHTELL